MTHPYDNPDIGPLEYDPERAAALLDEAGWVDSDGDGIRDKDGVSLSLRYATTTRQLRQDIQAVSQQQLAEIGIELILEPYAADIFFNGYAQGGPAATGNYDIAEWSSSPDAFPDPDTSRFTCAEIPTEDSPSGGNWNYYCNPELDALFEASQSETDLEARAALYHQIDAIIREDAVWLPLWFDADIWVVNPRLQNVRINGVFPFWDVVNWDVAE
jgi:peptide/nickel transport system substrate-binding protein